MSFFTHFKPNIFKLWFSLLNWHVKMSCYSREQQHNQPMWSKDDQWNYCTSSLIISKKLRQQANIISACLRWLNTTLIVCGVRRKKHISDKYGFQPIFSAWIKTPAMADVFEVGSSFFILTRLLRLDHRDAAAEKVFGRVLCSGSCTKLRWVWGQRVHPGVLRRWRFLFAQQT